MEHDRPSLAAPAGPLANTKNGSQALDLNQRLYYFEPVDEPQVQPGNEGLADLLDLLRSKVWVIAGVVILAALAGAGITRLETPVYEAKASLEIQAPSENVLGMQGGATATVASPESFLQTQVKTLESRTLQRKV